MPKMMLTGTLDEQCAFLLQLSEQKIKAGNYTGAIHALKEILKHAPTYPGAAEMLARAEAGKREQRFLVWSGFAGAVVFVFAGTAFGVPNDLWFLGLALLGVVVGYLVALFLLSGRSRSDSSQSGS